MCALCLNKAAFIPCAGRLTLEKDLENKVITCKHHGDHSCPLEIKGRSSDIEKTAREFPRVTREGMVRQKIQEQLGTSYANAVSTARNLTDKKFIDNIRQREKSKRRPDGHCFEAVKILKESYDKEDPYLIFSFHDGSDDKLPFVIKSSKLKVNKLVDLDKDGSHRLSTETVYLDVLHSR